MKKAFPFYKQPDHLKNTTLQNTEKSQLPTVSNEPQKEQMSLTGIGNAATGAALVEISKNFLTSRENKAATKKVLSHLIKINNKNFKLIHFSRSQRYK